MIQNKTNDKRDYYYYTFNEYNKKYPKELNERLDYVNTCWKEVQDIMLTLEEWYNDRICYHYIGYLLEYGKELDSENDISIPYLKNILTGISKRARTAKLKELIKHSLRDVKPENCFMRNRAIMLLKYCFCSISNLSKIV